MADRITPAQLLAELPIGDVPWLASKSLDARLRAAVAAPVAREYWKYTSIRDFLSPLRQQRISKPRIGGADQPGVLVRWSAAESPDTSPITSPRNEYRSPALGPADQAASERFPLADLGLLLTGDLLVLKITQSLSQPLTVDFEDGISVPLLIELADGVEASLIERSSAVTFGNHSTFTTIGRRARLQHARSALLQQSCEWSLNQVVLSEDSRYDLQQYLVGGHKRRTETHIILKGRNAESHVLGAYVVGIGGHLDQQLIVEHRAPDTLSRQRIHGIGAGKGTAIFNGRIHIHRDCPRSDATLSNKNLALSASAQINTKPELEIYTDDVKCAHGATVGQISAESLFYLQSRGLTDTAARRMLCQAFLSECISGPLAAEVSPLLQDAWQSVVKAPSVEPHVSR